MSAEDIAEKMASTAVRSTFGVPNSISKICLDKINKRRVYVESADEVPEGYEVQEGEQGGLYYEVESEGDPRAPGSEEGDSTDIDLYDTGDFDVDTEYEAAVAESVTQGWFGNTHHEDNYVAVRSIQHNIKQIENPDLLKEALEQEKEGRNARAMRDTLEKRLRSLEEEPPGEPDGDVPEVRQGTTLDSFTSEDAVNAVGYVMNQYDKDKANFEEWNQLLDNMTQDELKEALVKWSYQGPKEDLSPDMMDYEDAGDGFDDEVLSGLYATDWKQLAPVIGRLEDEAFWDAFEEIEEKDSDIPRREVLNVGVNWAKEADTRRKIKNEYGKTSRAPVFEEDYEDFLSEFSKNWTSAGTSHKVFRAMMADEYQNEDEDAVVYVQGKPMPSIEMPMEARTNMEKLMRESKDYHTKMVKGGYAGEATEDNINDDGTITLYRGVKNDVTSHATLESWSSNRHKADDFSGGDGSVLEAKVDPEDIIASKFFGKRKGVQFGYSDEDEFIVPGGALS